MKRVKGSQESVPYIEIGKSHVYIRTNVDRIEEDEFSGWEYDEIVVPIHEYVSSLASQGEIDTVAILIISLMREIDELRNMVGGTE